MQRYHEYRDGCEPDEDGEWVYYDDATAEIARLTRERDEARAEVGALRKQSANLHLQLDELTPQLSKEVQLSLERCAEIVELRAERDEWERRVKSERELFEDMQKQASNIAAERDEAIAVAVWAARKPHLLLASTAIAVNAGASTDADIYRALKEARNG